MTQTGNGLCVGFILLCPVVFLQLGVAQETVVRDTYPDPIVPFDLVSDLPLCQDNVKCDVPPDGDLPEWGLGSMRNLVLSLKF